MGLWSFEVPFLVLFTAESDLFLGGKRSREFKVYLFIILDLKKQIFLMILDKKRSRFCGSRCASSRLICKLVLPR